MLTLVHGVDLRYLVREDRRGPVGAGSLQVVVGARDDISGSHRRGRSCGRCGRRAVLAGGPPPVGVDRPWTTPWRNRSGVLTAGGRSHDVHVAVRRRPRPRGGCPQLSTGCVDNRSCESGATGLRGGVVHRLVHTPWMRRRERRDVVRRVLPPCVTRVKVRQRLYTGWGQPVDDAVARGVPRAGRSVRLLLDPVRQLGHLVVDRAPLGHELADLLVRVHDRGVVPAAELLADLRQ